MNETMNKLGYPGSLIREYRHWAILVRSKQVTLGSVVIATKHEVEALGSVKPDWYAELADVTAQFESACKTLWSPDKFNYLALMMVDPHVHFHIVPRYRDDRHVFGAQFVDKGWPKHPAMTVPNEVSQDVLERIRTALSGSIGVS